MKYTEETVNIIIKEISEGMSQKDAAILAGVSEDTVSAWKRDYPDFSDKVRKAEIKHKKEMVELVRKDAITNASSAKWWLERRHSDEYSERIRQDHTIEEANRVQAEEVKKIVNELTKPETEDSPEDR